jgi:hypothetical protein
MDLTLDTKRGAISFKFGLAFLGETIEATGFDANILLEKLQSNPFKYISVIMFHSAKYYALRKGKEFVLTQYDFADLIDEEGGLESKFFIDFMHGFNNSMTKDVPNETPQKSIEKRGKKVSAKK